MAMKSYYSSAMRRQVSLITAHAVKLQLRWGCKCNARAGCMHHEASEDGVVKVVPEKHPIHHCAAVENSLHNKRHRSHYLLYYYSYVYCVLT